MLNAIVFERLEAIKTAHGPGAWRMAYFVIICTSLQILMINTTGISICIAIAIVTAKNAHIFYCLYCRLRFNSVHGADEFLAMVRFGSFEICLLHFNKFICICCGFAMCSNVAETRAITKVNK